MRFQVSKSNCKSRSSETLNSYYSVNNDAHMAKPEPQKLFGPFVYQGEIKVQIKSNYI